MTPDGVMRHPSFEGLRDDKKPSEVVMEKEADTAEIVKKKAGLQKEKVIKPMAKGERKTLLNPSEKTQVRKVNGKELKFTNLSKIYWPKEKITKRELINIHFPVPVVHDSFNTGKFRQLLLNNGYNFPCKFF